MSSQETVVFAESMHVQGVRYLRKKLFAPNKGVEFLINRAAQNIIEPWRHDPNGQLQYHTASTVQFTKSLKCFTIVK